MTAKKRRTKKSAAQPRTFEEVRAANLADPFHSARIARLNSGETFDDPDGPSDDRWAREISVQRCAVQRPPLNHGRRAAMLTERSTFQI